jgi:AraC-like DNA-binding protein
MTHLSQAEGFIGTFSLTSSEGRLVERLLDILMDQGDDLNRALAEPLANGFLQAVSESLGTQKLNPPRRQKLFDKRLADIENYILMNLTDPDLCYDKVAASCGISPRYLCYLLKANNTSFSDLVWKNRLPQARDWLVSPAMRDYPIHEIAFMSGFKSAAHFSRMFKANYGCPPREFRAAHGITDQAANTTPEIKELELLAA